MRVIVAHYGRFIGGKPVETYARSMIRVFRELGHSVLEVPKSPPKTDHVYEEADLFLDIDCGRDDKGELRWHGESRKKFPCQSAIFLIDSHGHPTMHHRIAKKYHHVFYAVLDKKELFEGHPSAHWAPNFTDLTWFDGEKYSGREPIFDFGFFGSKGGLGRAQPLIEICNNRGWGRDVRQISTSNKHRWPMTAQAMADCRFLFNSGQKHDGPNLRVMESMAMLKPLITDFDERGGMNELFVPWTHYIPYDAYTYNGLEEAMEFCMDNPEGAKQIAINAYNEVRNRHLVENRINQILEVTHGVI
jgi:spore maturation protein CgeB